MAIYPGVLKRTNLETDPHVFEHQPENLCTYLEHSSDGACSIPTHTKAEVLINGLPKAGWLIVGASYGT